MEGRCTVETWGQFGVIGNSGTPNIRLDFGNDVFFCTGNDEVYFFNSHEKRLKAVLQFPAAVSDVVASHDTQHLFVGCRSGVYCVNMQRVGAGDASSSPAEMRMLEAPVVEAGGASSLLLVGSYLLTLCGTDTSWTLILSRATHQADGSPHEVLGSLHLPLLSEDLPKCGGWRPALVCVHCGDGSPPSSAPDMCPAHSRILLQPALFKLLFGVDAALAGSPVVVCGLPDGGLCFAPLRFLGAGLRLFHSLGQPVVLVGASAFTDSEPKQARCLVAVGERGRVLLMMAAGSEGGRHVLRFTDMCVPGRVKCACVDEKHLYCSTGSDLFMLDLSRGFGGGSEAAAPPSPSSLNVSRVAALSRSTSTALGDIQLLGLSLRGHLLGIKVWSGGSRRTNQAAGSIRDLLSAIKDVCERASVMKTAIRSKDQLLKQLNQVMNMSFLLKTNSDAKDVLPPEEQPIRCCAVAAWSRLLTKNSLNLKCLLENKTPYVMERGWTLSVVVFPRLCSPLASSACFTFPVFGLRPGGTLEVSLPVLPEGDALLPVRLSCSLVFSLRTFLGEEMEEKAEEGAGLREPQTSCFSLPINTLTVDWLHALRPVTSHSFSSTVDTIKVFLSSHQIRGAQGGRSHESKPEKFSTSIRLSTEFLREALKGSDGSEAEPKHLCVSLLRWLLSERCGGVKAGHNDEELEMSGSTIHAQAPNGATVKLAAKEVDASEGLSGRAESQVCVEVLAESSSLAAVCGLHHAVLCRVQMLLREASKQTSSTKLSHVSCLRRALQHVESRQHRIAEALSLDESSGQTGHLLLSIYQELRLGSVPVL